MELLGIAAFALALLVSVVAHEAGHFVTARHYGMKASKFFVGFGPTIWSRRRGETEYGVKAIPAGGFVKIEGMTPLEEIDPADEPRAFHNARARARLVVMSAGSFVHFVIAIVLVYGVLVVLGTTTISESRVGATSCIATTATCSGPGPAAAAGLRPGDRIVSFGGVPVTTWTQFTRQVRAHGAGPAVMVVERDGRTLTLTPNLVEVRRDRETGQAGDDRVGALGVKPGTETVHYNPIEAVPRTFDVIGSGFTGMYETLTRRIGDIGNIFSDNRDPQGFISVVGAARIGGDVVSAEGSSAVDRVRNLLILVAAINLAVGIFNLLPLLPLDGGHIAVLGFEQARHGLRRLRGYRGPVQKVDFAKLLPATYATVVVLLGFSLLVLSADIVNPIRLNQ
ncbi:putative membrane-associated Zn-dependent protease [Frankia casuarinae]|jgi:membrane-associated protease RseP (regulator of RpoE activity)|uniref:Peptidase M50 n=1 Tax=Frankia casuarinae (strain DSM 45818 / CECT 9043 / HFP020203 / CcI3) TaxID=106370 RepID=Q2J716_FRACC|nr:MULTISPECIES: site-2 protease family protein [Frankia]ABD12926.1 peptidase M50 [Frankia casuarinae]ETA03529.1 putative membrane-associated Zn-dependent protease [Frankia sp. CcI6]EYT93520.1 putative membrane-associated Zn-dependent protease [Frankia casuarinae]KDA43717.1 putative membrane-associated Zn-dependent protease [Frankia sp. BMG5.23]KFB05214.1 putative membrane-associated Zn-dependent protease [Frankia sp. Allo2]